MNDFSEHITEFNETISAAKVLISIARDSDLQRQSAGSLNDLLSKLRTWKREAIAARNEDQANTVLGMECVTRSLRSELNMWLLLKQEKPEQAWDELIAAQGEATHAVQAHHAFAHLEHQARRLEAIEKLVFPPQQFISAGLIVSLAICSICNTDYENCEHLVGHPYWGELCFRILKEVTADHVSLVEHPANKLCRVTHFSVQGGRRNKMTWRIETAEAEDETAAAEKGLTAEGIIATVDDIASPAREL